MATKQDIEKVRDELTEIMKRMETVAHAFNNPGMQDTGVFAAMFGKAEFNAVLKSLMKWQQFANVEAANWDETRSMTREQRGVYFILKGMALASASRP